ncbi:MAG: hypothetical protein JWP87_5414 [Labilithrix sp.]|nr:hypothetical protein [Labilithrix sp.]
MAAVARIALVATTLVGPLACYSPQQTGGASEALAIYQRSVRTDGAPQFRGRAGAGGPGTAEGGVHAPLTVEVAIGLAKKNSARLGELDARAAAAEAAVLAAGQRNNPELRATNVRVGRAIDRREDPLVIPRLRFYPERPGEIAAREAEARAVAGEARAAARAEESAIEGEIRWLFEDALVLDAEIAASERAAATRDKLAAQTGDGLRSATSTAVDADLATLYAIEAGARVAELRSRRTLLIAALLDRIGRGSGTKLELAGEVGAWPPPPLPSEQVLIAAALKQSPRIVGSAARIDAANARLHLEEGRRWPWFNFAEVGYEIQPATNNVPLFTVGGGIEVPLFHMNGGAVRQAEASRSAARQGLEAEVEGIVRDVRLRLREAEAAAALVTELRAASLPVLERAQTETARALEAGAIDTIRALTVEERRNLVELELFKLVRRYRTAVGELRRAIGGPLPSPSGIRGRAEP